MSYSIIDYPHFVPLQTYQHAIDGMVKRLAQNPATLAVYQIGGIGDPGISDLDMIVVFRDNEKVETNFLKNLSSEEGYLFIHNLYGIAHHQFADAERFTFFSSFKLLHGTDLRTYPVLPAEEIKILKQQIAFEFLIKMFINLYHQKSYRVLQMRDLLLHIKALQYDFEFLGINSGKLLEKILQVIEWRKIWFEKTPAKKGIINWWKEFNTEFDLFLQSLFHTSKFYLPSKVSYRVARTLVLFPSEEKISATRHGILLPHALSFMGKKYFKLQNKLNRYQFEVPVMFENTPPVLQQKFLFEKKHFDYNREFLPWFFTLTFTLHVS